MKKRFELVKAIQLILLILIAAAALWAIFTDAALYQLVGRDPSIRILCILLWLALALSFAGILWDFSTHNAFKKDYRELDHAVYNDHVAGIANRFSCDALIDKYVDKSLPDNIGCIMLDLTNLKEINEKYGHAGGNETIQGFSDILSTASVGICFVGRNGGNKFMALFEECTEEKINTFLANVDRLVNTHNDDANTPHIAYRTGRSFSREDRKAGITQLIALADRRLSSQTDTVTGAANRSGCDAVINKYLGQEMPKDLCCIMLEVSNIRRINEIDGHLAGNLAIRRFSDALREASGQLGFTGRNGGTKFMAIFEDITQEKLTEFNSKLRTAIDTINLESDACPIEYHYGIAFNENESVKDVSHLVALADRRLSEQTDRVTGFSNRAACDDIIAKYSDRPLPADIGCIMIDFSNIRDINETAGHIEGDRVLRCFGTILREAARGLCFVGRNGGTKFLALFEDCTDEKLRRFLETVDSGIETFNASSSARIEYRTGTAFHESSDINEIHRLLALADRRACGRDI